MNLVKLAAAVLNQTPLDWEGNKSRIMAAIEAARRDGVSVLCLPEMCIPGYGCEDVFLSPGLQRTAWQVLEELAPAASGMIVSLGLPVFYNGALYNAACLVVDGRIAGLTAKQFLPGDGIHYEPRWFKPWPRHQRASLPVGDASYPFGDLTFDVGGVRIGFEICEDAWVADRPGADLARRGVEIILNPSASHFAFGKRDVRQRFVLDASRSYGVAYVYANLLGNEAGRAIYDGGAMIASAGKLAAAGPRFSFADYQLTSAVVDIDALRMFRGSSSGIKATDAASEESVAASFAFPKIAPAPAAPRRAAWEDGANLKEEEFARAVALALFDYLRKSRSRGFVVSLSGGADSSTVAALVALAVDFGLAELGADGWSAKLPYLPAIDQNTQPRAVVGGLLTCVYQSTRNSTSVTRDAARGLSLAIGADFLEFDVDALVESYTEIVSRAIERPLSWDADDVALQNIQARARAPGVWMLANVRGALLLATSNRSEAAVGYATMDGDTCGGLSPIAGIDKAFLRRWLRWRELEGPDGLGPLNALAAVNVQEPTAELRPHSAAQTDEGDLMPYDVLDAVERAAIRDKLTPLEVYSSLRAEFAQHGASQMADWVERFFRLWCRNQWKRERYAPSFHLDDENLDPKTWCRFPILSGGYERELAELRAAVELEAAE